MADKEQKTPQASNDESGVDGRRDRLDSDSLKPGPLTETEASALDEIDVAEADSANDPNSPKLTRKDILSRLMGKSEVILKLHEENNAQAAEIAELKDRWIRTSAEFENYRKRTRKEWELLKQQSKAEVILEILGVADDFERAFSVADKSDSDEFMQGVRLIYSNFTQILEKLGISEVDSHHQPFDPNFHMAVGQIDSDDAESGTVVEVVEKGFYLDGNIIRPAKVIVAK